MSLPQQTFTVQQNGLGLVDPVSTRVLVIGTSSSGTANTLYSFSSIPTAVSTVGQGPGPEAVAKLLQVAGGPVDFLKTAGSTAGAAGAITKSGGGPTVTVAGAAYDRYSVVLTIVLGGVLGTATFTYTLDGSNTPSEVLTVPAGGTYAIPNTNLTLTFPAGTYVAAETYSFTTTAPAYTTSDLSTALATAFASSTEWAFVVFTGEPTSGANAATMAAAIDGHMTTFANGYKFLRGIADAGSDTSANVKTAFASFASNRVLVQYGDCDQVSAKPFAGFGKPKMPAYVPVAVRAAQVLFSTSLAKLQPLIGVSLSATDHDEFKLGAPFDGTKISTLRTHVGNPGVYVTRGELKSPAGSDFKFWQWGRVIDALCRTIFVAQSKFQNANLRTKTDGTGRLQETDAIRVETEVRKSIRAVLVEPNNEEGTPGHLSGVQYTVDRNNNYLATQTLRSEGAAVPLVPAEQIVTSVGLVTELV